MPNRFLKILMVCIFIAFLPVVHATGQSQHETVNPEQAHELEYVFALTKKVESSSIATPVKPFLFILTFGLDLALLPFAFIGEAISS